MQATERNHKEGCSEQEQVQNVFILVGAATQAVETQMCLVNLVHNFDCE